MPIFAITFEERNNAWEHSSVGLEHLPYKQRVGGSTPSAPTKRESLIAFSFFILCHNTYRSLPLYGKTLFLYDVKYNRGSLAYGGILGYILVVLYSL